MKHIYLIDFGRYYARMEGNLIYERIGKLPIVKVSRQWGDLPFIQYFKYSFYSKLSRWFGCMAQAIDYEIRVTEGMEKGVIWRKREDGLYEPYDELCDVSAPHLARKEPPTQKKVYGIFVKDTGKKKVAV